MGMGMTDEDEDRRGEKPSPGGGSSTDAWWPPGPGARRLVVDATALFGLAGIAITQPILDLFGNNPTFFVAGNYGRRKTVAFALAVALIPGLVAIVVTAPVRLFGERAGVIAHRVGVAVLAGLFGLVLGRTLGIDATPAAVVLAVAAGVGTVAAVARWSAARRFLAYLAVGNLVFLGLFLFVSPSSRLLEGTVYADAGSVTFPALDGPVTVLVLDEFPLTALLRPDGTIDEELFPNIAALADESIWFRNASAEVNTTYRSVPEILSGVRASEDSLPVYRDFPRNLFTLFGGAYPVHNYETVTDMCPPDTCARPPGKPLSQALSDALLVYRHRILPEALRSGLAPVDHGWGSFGDDVERATAASGPPMTTSSGEPDPMARLAEVPQEDGARVGQADAFRREMQAVTGEPAVNLIHVLLPHHPYELTPWGVSSVDAWVPASMPDPDHPSHERAFAELHAMQAMQVGAVDQMVGEVVARLRATGAWDTGTFVLVSDHGVDITAPRFTRVLTPESEDGILRIPLFVRAPGHTGGEVRDEPATTLDVLPSIIDLVGGEAEWEMDGHSLFDGSEPGYERLLDGETFTDGLDYVERQQEHLPDRADATDPWSRLVAIGEQGDLVGSRVDDHEVGAPSAMSWSYLHGERLADPDSYGGVVPVHMQGQVSGSERAPADLVVALDGAISGTLGGWVADGGEWAFSGLLGPDVEGGARDVVAYEVERDGDTVTLHPLIP
jgi:hypothetical protein